MATIVRIEHQTRYHYDRPVTIFPQIIRLSPAQHNRTCVGAYALEVRPENHRAHRLQDPFGNRVVRCFFPESSASLEIDVELVARLEPLNAFDFLLEGTAAAFPFSYDVELSRDLAPFLGNVTPPEARFRRVVSEFAARREDTLDFLAALNQRVRGMIRYRERLEPGVREPETTLALGEGSCRDSSWLLCELFRAVGLASRFVSGYLIQLKPVGSALDDPNTPKEDSASLHAWAEVFLPGAGWLGLDPTSGLFTGEGHIALAVGWRPGRTAPVEGEIEPCTSILENDLSLERLPAAPPGFDGALACKGDA